MRILAIIPMVALAACAEAPMEDVTEMAPTPIMEEAEFLAMLGDQTVVLEGTDNSVVIGTDGSIGGMFAGAALAGSWEWREGAWCRTLTAGPRGPSPEDCQVWSVTSDGKFVVTRDRGNGTSFTYVLT